MLMKVVTYSFQLEKVYIYLSEQFDLEDFRFGTDEQMSSPQCACSSVFSALFLLSQLDLRGTESSYPKAAKKLSQTQRMICYGQTACSLNVVQLLGLTEMNVY